MPLYKRSCTECSYLEDDLYERPNLIDKIECPKCHKITFKKRLTAPSYLDCGGFLKTRDLIDRERQKAADGYGNTSF